MRFRKGFKAGAIVLAVLLLDRLTKNLAMRTFAEPIIGIPGIVQWRYCENTGAAFSALSGAGSLVGWLSGIMLVVLAAYLLWKPQIPRAAQYCLWAVVAGGASNFYDRVRWGFVIDFIEPLFVRFAVFNVADCFITLGALTAAILVLFHREVPG